MRNTECGNDAALKGCTALSNGDIDADAGQGFRLAPVGPERPARDESTPHFALCTRNSKGFSLIEVIIVIMVIGLAAGGVLSVYTAGIKGSADPILINQAVSLAQGEMAAIIGQKKQAGGFVAIGTAVTGPCTSAMLVGFTCARNIYYVNPGIAGELNTPVAGPTDYKHINVTITIDAPLALVAGDVVLDGLVTNY